MKESQSPLTIFRRRWTAYARDCPGDAAEEQLGAVRVYISIYSSTLLRSPIYMSASITVARAHTS